MIRTRMTTPLKVQSCQYKNIKETNPYFNWYKNNPEYTVMKEFEIEVDN